MVISDSVCLNWIGLERLVVLLSRSSVVGNRTLMKHPHWPTLDHSRLVGEFDPEITTRWMVYSHRSIFLLGIYLSPAIVGVNVLIFDIA